MKKIYVFIAVAMTVSANFASVQSAKASSSCSKEAIAAAKSFAADDGDEACAGEERTHVTDISNGRNSTLVYTIDVNCGGGTSFTETVITDIACKVVNQH